MHALLSQSIKTTDRPIEGHKYNRRFNWKSQYNTIGFCGQVDFFFNLFVTSPGLFWGIFVVKDLVVIFVVLFLLLVNNKT